MFTIGQTIKTVYGTREIVNVNKSSVTVKLDDCTMRIAMSQVRIMN